MPQQTPRMRENRPSTRNIRLSTDTLDHSKDLSSIDQELCRTAYKKIRTWIKIGDSRKLFCSSRWTSQPQKCYSKEQRAIPVTTVNTRRTCGENSSANVPKRWATMQEMFAQWRREERQVKTTQKKLKKSHFGSCFISASDWEQMRIKQQCCGGWSEQSWDWWPISI